MEYIARFRVDETKWPYEKSDIGVSKKVLEALGRISLESLTPIDVISVNHVDLVIDGRKIRE